VVHGTVKGLLGLISTLVFVVVAAAAALVWRLSQGPLPLPFLNPAIEQALDDVSGKLTLGLDDTQLTWDADARALAIHLRNVRALGPDGRILALVPDVSVSFYPGQLLRGHLALRRARLIRPELRLLRDQAGVYALGLGDEADAQASAILDAAVGGTLVGAGAGNQAGGLERLEIVEGDLEFDDRELDMHWRAPHVDLLLARVAGGVSGMARGDFDLDGKAASLAADGLYRTDGSTLSGTLRWTGIKPASFARLSPALEHLARLQLVTAGRADFSYAPTSGLTALAFDATGGPGTIDVASWIGTALKVGSVTARGKLANGLDDLTLDELRLDLGGSKIALTAQISGLKAAPRIAGSAIVDNLPLDTLKTLWPATLAPDPRAWIAANLSGGTIRHAEAKLTAKAAAGGSLADAQVAELSGSIQGEGIAVHYLGSLPSVRNVAVSATFDADTMTIAIKGGTVGGATIKDGTIKLAGLAATEQTAAIDLDVDTTVPEALKLIDSRPLGYASALGFDPSHARGDARVNLDLRLPLLKALRLSQMKLQVRARTVGLAIPKAALGLDLAEGALTLDVDPRGMEVTGTATLDAIPIDLKWHENFAAAPFRSRYEVKAELDDAGRKAIGLDDPAFQPPVLAGKVPIEAVATMYEGGRGTVSFKADLGPAAMRLPGLNWSKAQGAEGRAEADLRLVGDNVAAVPRFAVEAAGGMAIRGDMAFDNGGRPRRIALATAKWGRTDLKGSILFKPDGSQGVDVSGSSFDASELVGGGSGEHHLEERAPLTVSAKLGRVWLSDAGSIANVAAVLSRGPRHWRFIRVDATVGEGKPMHIEVRPADAQHRALKVASDDAGGVFGAFGVLKNMRGGTLAIDGTYDDTDPREPLSGTVKVSDYREVKAPLLARVLTVASLTGAADVLSGDGIHFDKADAPFTLIDGVITLKDARTYGTEIGLTVDGQIDLDNDQLALQGTIVPAYAINNAFNKIPLIGNLLTGGKGGGLIAFNYSVKGPSGNPEVQVNPLSALTPGFLRGLFGIFDNGSGTKVPAGRGGQSGQPAADGSDR